MNTPSRITFTLGTAAMMLASGSSFALPAYDASVSISNIQLSVTDQFGVSTTPVLKTVFESIRSSVYSSTDGWEHNDSNSLIQGPQHSYTATQDGYADVNRLDLIGTVNSTAHLERSVNPVHGSVSADAGLSLSNYFVLAPYATVNFSALASGAIKKSDVEGVYYWTFANAYAGLDVYPGNQFNRSETLLYTYQTIGNDSSAVPKSFSTILSLDYTNRSELPMNFALFLSADASITRYPSDPAAVPEPANYAMLAGGLLLLGAVTRRKGKPAQA